MIHRYSSSRLIARLFREVLRKMSEIQNAINDMKAEFVTLRTTITEALDKIDNAVKPDPDAADDAQEIEAVVADVKSATQTIRDALDKPVFAPSGN